MNNYNVWKFKITYQILSAEILSVLIEEKVTGKTKASLILKKEQKIDYSDQNVNMMFSTKIYGNQINILLHLLEKSRVFQKYWDHFII